MYFPGSAFPINTNRFIPQALLSGDVHASFIYVHHITMVAEIKLLYIFSIILTASVVVFVSSAYLENNDCVTFVFMVLFLHQWIALMYCNQCGAKINTKQITHIVVFIHSLIYLFVCCLARQLVLSIGFICFISF